MSQATPVAPSEPIGILSLGARSLTYALGGLAYKGVAIIAVPILARLLTPAELGVLDFAAVLATIVGLTAALGSDQAVAYLEPRSGADVGVWSSTLVLIGAITAAFVALALLAGEPVVTWLGTEQTSRAVILAAAAYGGVIALAATTLNAIRLHGSPRAYALASFAIVTVEMAAAITAAGLLNAPIAVMVAAWAVGALVVSVPLLVRYMPSLGAPRRSTIARIAAFGAPLVPAAVAWLVGDAWIRSVIARSLEPDALGQYGIAFRIASVAVLAVTGFGVAWQPYIFRTSGDQVHARAGNLLPVLVLGLGAGSALLTVLAPEIILLAGGDAYLEGRRAVAPLSAGAVMLGVFVLSAAVVAAGGSTRHVAIAALGGMGAQIVGATVLVSSAELFGAGVASLLGYLVAVGLLIALEPELRRLGSVRLVVSAALVIGATAAATVAQDAGVVVRGGLGAVLAVVLAVTIRSMAGRGAKT